VLRGLFVTGTDTNVGKTVVAAALLHRYRRLVPLRYWKPIQTGIEHDDDTAEVCRLAGCGPGDVWAAGVRLPRRVSPHLAAKLSGQTISVQSLVEAIDVERGPARWIVEGAGGALVPINDSELMIDLMGRLALPVVVAARTALGTINHTLLTLEALRARSLLVAGVVMVGRREPENRLAIERYGRIGVLAEMPRFDPLTSEQLAAWSIGELDRESRLLEFLQ
jgi:dethiobiotin synthase